MAWKWILNGKINPIQDLQRKSSIQKKKAAREMIEFSNIKENLSNETWEGTKGLKMKKNKAKKSIWEAWAMGSKQKKECQDGDGMRNNI